MAIFNSYVSLPEGIPIPMVIFLGDDLPSGYVNSLLLKMTIEIVDFPMKNGGFFNSKLLNYQRLFLFYPTLTGCSAPHFMEPPIEKSLRMASPAVTIYDRATGTRRSRSTTHPTPHHLNVLRCRVTAE